MDEEKPQSSIFERLEGRRQSVAEQFEETGNWKIRLLGALAPDKFYRWPLWKKLLLAIPALILLFAAYTLYFMFRVSMAGGY